MEKSEKKLREMILYAAGEFRESRDWNLTRLLRVLFHSDFRAYRLLGSSISGSLYRRVNEGPAPEGVLSVISTMEREGLCAWAVDESSSCRKLLALRDPDLTVLSATETDLLKTVLEGHRDLGLDEVGDFSDGYYGWLAAYIGEDIPYGTASVGRPRPLTSKEIAWAHEAIREHLERTTTLPPSRQKAAI